MPITRIHIENFKSFSVIDVELSRLNVVIGSNAAGKSNFISAFRFLRDIARHGIVNAIAMQGGADYIRNTKIGTARDLAVQVVYEPEPGQDVIDRTGKNGSLLEVRSCESSYEFALHFNATGDGFSIVRDQLLFGCEVSSCGNGSSRKEKNPVTGKGSVRVSSEKGEVKHTVDIPPGCPLTENDVIPLFFRGKKLPERTLLLETMYGYPLPHFEKFFDRIAIYDIDPKLSKKGTVITGKRELEENAGNLALVVKSILENPEKKRKFANLLRDTLPFVEDFSVQKFMDISLILTMRERYAQSRDLPASSLSDGTITIFAMIIALYFEKKTLHHYRGAGQSYPPVPDCTPHEDDEGSL